MEERVVRAPSRGLTAGHPAWKMAVDIGRRMAVAAMFRISHLNRRDPRIWIFGNYKGFRDNPRYLAEHIVATRPDIQAWWIARRRDEAEAAASAGLNVAMRQSREGKKLHQHAGVAFLSNAFMDLRAGYLGGAFIVHLYHGTALKRILLDTDLSRMVEDSALTRAVSRVRRIAVARTFGRIDMIAAAGELAKTRFITAFGLPPKRIQILGTPRFDVIAGGPAYDRVVHGDLRATLGLTRDQHVVLWLPTWRERGDASWLPTLEVAQVDAALADTDAVLVVKTHPYSDIAVYRERLPDHPRVRLLAEAEVDVNSLLTVADTLVSDYSSTIFDYVLLRRPIHFFAPDAADYAGGRGLYEPYEKLTGGRHHAEWPTLLAAVADSAAGVDAEGMMLMRRVADMAGNMDAPGSCERIVQAVASAVGLP